MSRSDYSVAPTTIIVSLPFRGGIRPLRPGGR
jgi:hypothetical protein